MGTYGEMHTTSRDGYSYITGEHIILFIRIFFFGFFFFICSVYLKFIFIILMWLPIGNWYGPTHYTHTYIIKVSVRKVRALFKICVVEVNLHAMTTFYCQRILKNFNTIYFRFVCTWGGQF